MKKKIALVLAAALVGSALIGCGSSSSSGNSQSGSTATTAATQAAQTEAADTTAAEPAQAESDEEIVLEVWCWDPIFNGGSITTAAAIYAQDHPNVSIHITECSSTDIYTRLTSAALAGQEGTLPDIMLMHDKNIKKYVSAYEGIFADLTDSGINYSDFAQYKVAAGTVDGRIYNVPFDNAAAVTALRTDVLEEAGYTIDDFTDLTWEEYIEIGKDVYAKTGKSILSERSDKPQVINIMLQSAGTWFFDEDGKTYISNNPVMKRAFEVYKEMVDNHVMSLHNDNESYYSSFWSGEAGGAMNGSYVLGNIMNEPSQSGLWDITNTPRFGDIDASINYSNNGGSSWLVLEGPHKEVAADFLKGTFAGSVELYNKVLEDAAAIATWLPGKEAENYDLPVEFFSNKPIYADIVEFADHVPSIDYGVYTAEAQDAICSALSKMFAGESIDKVLQDAQAEVEFAAQ